MQFSEIRGLRRRSDLGADERARLAAGAFGPPDLAEGRARLAESDARWAEVFLGRVAMGEAPEPLETERFLLLAERVAGGHLTSPFEPTELIGRVVGGRYRVESLVGEGGFAVVFRGRHLETTAAVALKFLHPSKVLRREMLERLADPVSHWETLVARFTREARAQATLDHPGIATVFDFWAEADGHFQALEFLDGQTLAEVIAAEAPMDIGRAARIFVDACAALDAAHARGVVHRDVTPSNVFVCRREWGEVVKVIDFGIAKILREAGAESTVVTRDGEFFCTCRYASPEQFSLEDIAPASDVYSLGVVLFEMLTGRVPFEGGPALLAEKHVCHPAPDVEEWRAEVPKGLADAVRLALAKRPDARPSRARDLARLVEPFVAGRSDARPERAPEIDAPRQSRPAGTPEGLDPADLAEALAARVFEYDPVAVAEARVAGGGYAALVGEIEAAYADYARNVPAGAPDHLWPALVAKIGGGDPARLLGRRGEQ